MGADHPLPPECHDYQQRLEDAEFSRAPWKDWVDCKRRTANGREFQSIMVQGKNECLKTSVQTGNNKFLFIGGSNMPWWNWNRNRNGWKVIQRLATLEQGQPTKFVEQTSDRSCMAIIFFNKTGSTTLNCSSWWISLAIYGSHAAAAYSKLGRTKDR